MTLPPQDLLRVNLTVDGAPEPVLGADLVVLIDGTGLDEATGKWVHAERSEITVVATLVTAARQYFVRLPPGPLGMSFGSPDDDPAAALATIERAEKKPRRAEVATAQVERPGPAHLRARLGGTLGHGAAFSLELDGSPTAAQATVVAADGRARAVGLLLHALPGLDAGELSDFARGDEEDATVLVRWESRRVAELEQAERERDRQAREAARAEAERAALEALRAVPVPEPTDAAPLVAARRGHAVQRATLALVVTCDAWDPAAKARTVSLDNQRVNLAFEVVVDEASGEDGALAPSFEFEARTLPFELPLDGAWHGLDARAGGIESWFGNDAPELLEHTFAYRVLSPTEVEVDWRASYDDWGTKQPEQLRYRGRATLGALWLDAPGEALLPEALERALGPVTRARVELGPATARGTETWSVARAALRLREP
jgi:hypothetical protein